MSNPLPEFGAQPSPLQWIANAFPYLAPVASPGTFPIAPPIGVPWVRPNPWSVEAPSVGPKPGEFPAATPAGFPGLQPLPIPPELPGLSPGSETVFPPVVQPIGEIVLTPGHAPRINPRSNPRARTPPRGTKERKVKMGRVMSFMWNAVGTITEHIDTIDLLYEALPITLKIKTYHKLGRQPNPKERAEIVYANLQDMDVEMFIISFVKNDLEDRLYALGGSQVGQAARDRNRPIGFEAGGSLTGGGEYVPTEGGPPEWWPQWLPWAP